MSIILHIAEPQRWKDAQASGRYQPQQFAAEGFIHCSTPEQVIQVANARFRGRTDLVLLTIDTDQVGPEILYENLEGGSQLFPHIYGELNLDAVTEISDFIPGSDGYFSIP